MPRSFTLFISVILITVAMLEKTSVFGQVKKSSLSVEAEAHVVKTAGYVDPKKFMQPHSVWATQTHLYVTDYTNIRNGRLLIYDNLRPEPTDEPRVIERVGGADPDTLYAPSNVVVFNNRCYLTDFGHKRLLIYDTPLPKDGDTPTVITSIGGVEPAKLNAANGLFVTADALYMTDTFQHRLIVWDTPVPKDGQKAHVFQRLGGGIEPDTLKNLRSVCVARGRCYLDDFDNHRLLMFDSPLPKDGDVPVVIKHIGGVEPATFNGPIDIAVTDEHLLVIDFKNDRILIYDTFDLVDGLAPVGVIDCASRGNQIRPDILRYPRDMYISDKSIYVTGFYTDRLLIFDRHAVLGN